MLNHDKTYAEPDSKFENSQPSKFAITSQKYHRLIFIIMGPSASGKTSLQKYMKKIYHVIPVITHTTRKKRANEQNGKDYYFETKSSWPKNNYLEETVYAGNHYGSSIEGLKKAFKKSDLVSIVLDQNGAKSYLKRYPNLCYPIQLSIKNSKELKNRMLKRGDSLQSIHTRLHQYEVSMNSKSYQKNESLIHPHIIDCFYRSHVKAQIDKIMLSL